MRLLSIKPKYGSCLRPFRGEVFCDAAIREHCLEEIAEVISSCKSNVVFHQKIRHQCFCPDCRIVNLFEKLSKILTTCSTWSQADMFFPIQVCLDIIGTSVWNVEVGITQLASCSENIFLWANITRPSGGIFLSESLFPRFWRHDTQIMLITWKKSRGNQAASRSSERMRYTLAPACSAAQHAGKHKLRRATQRIVPVHIAMV